jgi:glycosyltransferase involved in cell wall biosynthesis
MARIYLDARTITETPSGVGRYARSLIPELVGLEPDHDWVLVRHASNREPLDLGEHRVEEAFVDLEISELPNALFGSRRLRRVFDRYGEPDLYHSLFHVTPSGLDDVVPTVVTLHDLIWLDHPHISASNWLEAKALQAFGRWAIPRTLRDAAHVVCVSEPTADRARPWLDSTPHTTIPHGVDDVFFESSPPPEAVIDEWPADAPPHVVAIGNDKYYKNLGRLVAAFRLAKRSLGEAKLVLIGSCEGLRARIEALDLEPHVYMPGFLEDEALRSLLAHARAFVFPSLVEGFGLPVLEAMASGTPAIVSDREPMRTVAGEAARLVDPCDTEALTDALREVFGDEEQQERLIEAGRRRAESFDWTETARRTHEVYRSVLERR